MEDDGGESVESADKVDGDDEGVLSGILLGSGGRRRRRKQVKKGKADGLLAWTFLLVAAAVQCHPPTAASRLPGSPGTASPSTICGQFQFSGKLRNKCMVRPQ